MMKVYDIWSEGYAATGESGSAWYVGRVYAESFKEACDAYAASDERFKNFYNSDRLTHWVANCLTIVMMHKGISDKCPNA